MATQSSQSDTEIRRPDEPRNASNQGMNRSLILAFILSVVLIVCAILLVRHSDYTAYTRPDIGGASTPPPTNTESIAPGTTGANVLPPSSKEERVDRSALGNQAVQSDTISPLGPGAFPKQPQASSSTQSDKNQTNR